jgi:hypothetical protein
MNNQKTLNKFQKLSKEFKKENVILIHNKKDLKEENKKIDFKIFKKSSEFQQIESCLNNPEDFKKIIEMILNISQKIQYTKKIKKKELLNIPLLGPGEVGKTSIFKKIKKIKNNTYNKRELEMFQYYAQENVLFGLRKMFELLNLEGWEPEDPKFVQDFLNIDEYMIVTDSYSLLTKFKDQMKDLCKKDKMIQDAILHHHKYQMHEGFPYLMNHLDEISNEEIVYNLNKSEEMIMR